MYTTATSTLNNRIRSIDTVRGLIIIIMALDHVRDFFHIAGATGDPTDLATTTPALFFTRWITHYCAPSFMMLSGLSAYLSGLNKTAAEKSAFLIKRGFWLILVEMVFMTFAFTFDIYYKTLFFAVFWALGGAMIVLGIAVRFASPKTVLMLGLALVLGHNLLDYVKLQENSTADILLRIFFTGRGTFLPRPDGGAIVFLYVIFPWAGIMMSGYGLGMLYNRNADPARRRKLLILIGSVLTVLFVVLRLINEYGDPAPWSTQDSGIKTFMSFLNVTKYPPSLFFTFMTQGPILILLALTEQTDNAFSRICTVYGRVPFFFFLVHFYLIHIMTMVIVFLSGYTWQQATDDSLFFKFRPNEFGYPLGQTYLIWILIVVALYWPCKWYGEYRARKRTWWLSYL
ncbi:putative membrane protein [Dyadobacter sp. BE34]|uniref:Membrane protein n=1 Tax=Dyadobacter fermentans TaxID=94254 RepID=A0ABU1R6N7_9BACT|nr:MULTISPECIES: heparan-alpha-glucosaminide N-acetyltransferase domain-containing protein [Dyadobacter]MDR6809069.1 putative membrane protein [Dyadobacter fermentans]MDR7046812.1 putative membrane protein [Dyadobacter sp. BE242]MDR7201126.1 putative membrane protein [Dyadobacter sp. BE34]MDR7219086.1 putative membrane protein [Dyadobacter sp. BE31]MDR7264704.1 putative membrane protein [Dyadobacter sp. BE32]